MPAGVRKLVCSCLEKVRECEEPHVCSSIVQPGGLNQNTPSTENKNGYIYKQFISLSADDILRSDLFSSDIRDAYNFLKDLRTKAPGEAWGRRRVYYEDLSNALIQCAVAKRSSSRCYCHCRCQCQY